MSGHSKWATTKRHKAAVDAKRSNLFTKLAKNITVAARSGHNLDLAVETAKKASMPKDNIQRAIDRGLGKIDGAEITETTYEAYGPAGVGIIIKVLTDNKNRAISELKAVLNKNNGKLATSGAVSYLFENKGEIVLEQKQDNLNEEVELAIIESGASDYELDDNTFYIYTDPSDLNSVKASLEKQGLKIDSAKISLNPTNYIDLDESQKQSVIKLLEKIEDLDDVDSVYTNANL